MHALIINGSPRVKKYSNTDKILEKFTEGMCINGSTFEQYEVSDRNQWDDIRRAYHENRNILIAIPLFVECIPGLLLEFLETLTPKNDGTELAFILQGGFAEGSQLRCGEAYLKMLSDRLGCRYRGTLCKGNNFSIRFFEGKQREGITQPYREMGIEYGETGGFESERCGKFTGPENFPGYIRFILGILFKTAAKKGFKEMAKGLGCDTPIEYRPY